MLEVIFAAYESAGTGGKCRLPFKTDVDKPYKLWNAVNVALLRGLRQPERPGRRARHRRNREATQPVVVRGDRQLADRAVQGSWPRRRKRDAGAVRSSSGSSSWMSGAVSPSRIRIVRALSEDAAARSPGSSAGPLHPIRLHAREPAAECERIRSELAQRGPIDVCILGLGVNGHIGFNEPGPSLDAPVSRRAPVGGIPAPCHGAVDGRCTAFRADARHAGDHGCAKDHPVGGRRREAARPCRIVVWKSVDDVASLIPLVASPRRLSDRSTFRCSP